MRVLKGLCINALRLMPCLVNTKTPHLMLLPLKTLLSNRRTKLFAYDTVRNSWMPSRISFFALKAIYGWIITLDQLKRRGWKISNKCYQCKEAKMVDHILHCSKVGFLWQIIYALFGVQQVMPSLVRGCSFELTRVFFCRK